MTVTKKLIGRLPILIGEYDSTKAYNKKQRVTLYGSEFESKVDNNSIAPATLNNGNLTINTDNWRVVSNGSEAFLAGEKIKHFNEEDNPEFVSVNSDSDGKLLESTDTKGNKVFYADVEIKGNINCNSLTSEIKKTLGNKVDKEEGKSLINKTFADNIDYVEDPEKRLDAQIDSDGRVLSYRDKDGVFHENVGIDTRSLLVNNKPITYGAAFDWSKENFVEIPIPSVAAKVNLIVERLATAKGQNIKGYIEFWDKSGNYFKKPIKLNAQGSSSMDYWKKNQAIDIDDGSTIKFGNWVPQDSFHIKKFYIDAFRGQCIVGYWLTEQVYKSNSLGKQRPYDYLNKNNNSANGSGSFRDDFESGALCHPDGFPVILYLNGVLQGLYAFCLKKHRDNYQMKKNNHLQIHLDGVLGSGSIWNGGVAWNMFEIRNPKIDKNINGKKYDGDNPSEPSSYFQDTKDAITRLSKAYADISANKTKQKFEEYFNVPFYIDYVLISNVLYNFDGFTKNWQWVTWDGKIWCPLLYDLDSIFGMFWNGTRVIPAGDYRTIDEGEDTTDVTNTNECLGLLSFNGKLLKDLYLSDIKERYKELRDNNIFTTENIVGLLQKWLKKCGYDNLNTDINICCSVDGVPQTPSYRDGSLKYSMNPSSGGFYNSILRVKTWLNEHFKYLDTIFEYTIK